MWVKATLIRVHNLTDKGIKRLRLFHILTDMWVKVMLISVHNLTDMRDKAFFIYFVFIAI